MEQFPHGTVLTGLADCQPRLSQSLSSLLHWSPLTPLLGFRPKPHGLDESPGSQALLSPGYLFLLDHKWHCIPSHVVAQSPRCPQSSRCARTGSGSRHLQFCTFPLSDLDARLVLACLCHRLWRDLYQPFPQLTFSFLGYDCE